MLSELLEFQQQVAELNKSEIEGKKAGKLFTILFNNSPIGIYIMQDGKFQFVNPEFQRLTGYSKDELLGIKNPLRIVFPKDRSTVREIAVKALNGEHPYPYEYRYVKKNGETRWAMETVTAVQNDRRQMIVGTFMDITEFKLAGEALRESEEQYRTMLRTALDGFLLMDTRGNFIEVNEAYCRMTGYSRKELLSMSLQDVEALETPEEIAGRIREIIETGGCIFETGHRCRDGNVIDIEASVNYNRSMGGRLVCFLRNISQRKLAEEKLRLSEERFSKAFNASPNPMAIITLKGERFIDVNESFLRTTDYRYEEVVNRTLNDLNLLITKRDLIKISKMLNKQRSVQNQEIRFRKKCGEIRVVLFSAEIINLGGEQCILAEANDITEYKKLKQEMTRLDRLNLVGQMASAIGHEVRNPMTTVRGFLQLLKGKKECAKYGDYYDLMIEELDRANSIITEFLYMAKNKKVDKKMKNLNSIMEAIIPLIQANAMQADKYIEYELGEVADLLLDEKEVRQVILNLTRNGLEAMLPGGILAIKTVMDSNDVVLSVQDQGKGIAPEHLEMIGTPFFTTKDQGTGLGLAVCYGIAARHNASIDVETGPAGTTFFVRFRK